MGLEEVAVRAVAPERLVPLIDRERGEAFLALADAVGEQLRGVRVVNVNSTATGGGVAELLQTLLAYGQGAGIDTRWLVIGGEQRFFEITKRIHNHLYGTAGDGGPLGRAEARDYEQIARRDIDKLRKMVRPVMSSCCTIRRLRHWWRRCAKPVRGWSGVAMSVSTNRTSIPSRHGASFAPMSRPRIRSCSPEDSFAPGWVPSGSTHGHRALHRSVLREERADGTGARRAHTATSGPVGDRRSGSVV